jgi:signal transduction histidine kinase
LSANRVIAGMADTLRYLVGDGIELTVECAPDTGLIWANAGQIEQILLNLVANARDAIPETGRIAVQTANVDVDQAYGNPSVSGRFVMVAVSDTGSGIDDQTLPHIFEPFFTTKENGHGTGLGLSTVYSIVHHSGGHIAVESEPRQGTSFRVYLPRITEE